jgi:hypothetical protein
MIEQSQNPFFVLGVDFGASGAAATVAFGKASKRVKRDPNALFGVEDLTKALNEIEQAHRDGDVEQLGHHFRVPADPQAYEVEANEGLLLLPVRKQPRKTSRLSQESITAMVDTIVAQASETFFQELEDRMEPYGLPVQLGSELSLDQGAPSMTAKVKELQLAATRELAAEIRVSTDTDKLTEWASTVLALGNELPTTTAEAFVGNRKIADKTLQELLESSLFPKDVTAQLASSTSTSEQALKILAKSKDAKVRALVAANESTPTEVRQELRKDDVRAVRRAAGGGFNKWWLVLIAAAIVAVIVGIVLSTQNSSESTSGSDLSYETPNYAQPSGSTSSAELLLSATQLENVVQASMEKEGISDIGFLTCESGLYNVVEEKVRCTVSGSDRADAVDVWVSESTGTQYSWLWETV